MDALSHLVVKRDGDLTTITLDRPEKRNALALDVLLELDEVFDAVGATDARGVVLAANGPVFSAGHNFGDMLDADYDDARRLLDVCARLMHTVQSIPQPVCAKVHALATAAGCQLVATCDLAVAAESAGVRHPRWQGRAVLPHAARRRGPQRRAQAGARDGVHRRRHRCRDGGRVGPDQPRRARRRARRRRRRPHGAGDAWQRRCRRRSASGRSTPRSTSTRPTPTSTPSSVMAAAVITPDAQEGITAFLEKRKPTFDGSVARCRTRPA